jgi:YtkA-like
MHVRMAPEAFAGRVIVGVVSDGPRVPGSARVARSRGSLAMLVVSCCILAGCSRRGADVTVTWRIDPPRPVAGVEIVVQLSVRNRDGTPATGVNMQCAAQMSHPGMAPIISPIVERGSGTYETRLHLSMPGDWILVASGELPGGRSVTSSFRIPGVAPAKTPASLP